MLERVENVLRLLPEPAKQAAKRAAWSADAVLVPRFRRRTGYRGPFPPARLRARVGAGIRPDVFYWTGHEVVAKLEEALNAQRRSLKDCRCVYDWGCGCGRLLMHLPARCAADARIIGTDVDDEAVSWAAQAWPHLEIKVNDFRPPLPVGDGEVDCLISSSIFTHLTESDQDRWLQEVHRVLAPDGIALISLMGREMHARMRAGEFPTRSREMVARLTQMPDLLEAGFIFEPYEVTAANRADFTGITDVYGVAFHSPAYVEGHWQPWLRVIDHHPAAVNYLQDLFVLARQPESA